MAIPCGAQQTATDAPTVTLCCESMEIREIVLPLWFGNNANCPFGPMVIAPEYAPKLSATVLPVLVRAPSGERLKILSNWLELSSTSTVVLSGVIATEFPKGIETLLAVAL